MSVAEWDGLEWWEQRLLREGLAEEFSDPEAEPREESAPAGPTVMSGVPGEFSAVGMTERTLTRGA